MKEKKIDITGPYSIEVYEIRNKLQELQNGRIMELTGANMDGGLAHNIVQLRKMISDLILKVEYGKDSELDKMDDIF